MVTFTQCLDCFERPVHNKTRRQCTRCYQAWYKRVGGNLMQRGINQGLVKSGTRPPSETNPDYRRLPKHPTPRFKNDLGCVWCKQMFRVKHITRRDIEYGKQQAPHSRCQSKPPGFDNSSPRATFPSLRVSFATCLVNDCHKTYAAHGLMRQCGNHTSNECTNWVIKGRYHTDDVYRTAVIVQTQATRAARGEYTSNEIALRWLQRLDYYQHRCYLCGVDVKAGHNLEWEHVKPKAAGGHPWLPCNIRPACKTCNRDKADTWHGVCIGGA